MKEGRRGKWLSYFLLVLWLFSMALAGFFVPHFTDNIPFFKIKVLRIEGAETIPPQLIVEEVKKLKNNWLFINESALLKNINNNTGNAVKSIDIKRIFSSNGVELKIIIKERKPLFYVISNGFKVFFDEDGIMFQSPYVNTSNPLVHTHDIKLIKENFENIKDLISLLNKDLKEVYITTLATITYLKGGVRIILPPPFLLDEGLLERVAKLLKDYNIDMYAKELEISEDGLVIIRGGKGNEIDNISGYRHQ